MSVRLRLGPFRISSRGRVGVRVGPVSVSGGGHRRKRSSAGNTRASSQAAFERRTAKDQVWFRKQAAAERRAAKSDRNRPHDHDSDLANEYYERCVVELKKWKDSNAALLRRTQFTLHERYRENGMPTEKRWAAFTVSVQNTVKALDNVISAASAAKDAEERAFRSHYKFHGSNKGFVNLANYGTNVSANTRQIESISRKPCQMTKYLIRNLHFCSTDRNDLSNVIRAPWPGLTVGDC
jgi:hypothetical protein